MGQILVILKDLVTTERKYLFFCSKTEFASNDYWTSDSGSDSSAHEDSNVSYSKPKYYNMSAGTLTSLGVCNAKCKCL